MRKVFTSYLLCLLSLASYAQVQHTTGQTLLINPTGRTLVIERDNEDSWLTFHDPNDHWYSFGIDRSNSGALSLNFGGEVNSSQFVMDTNGNVGLGTGNPGGWKLAVNGNIRAKEIKVETGWADFVFEKAYDLPDLKDVEAHIKEKGHLKDIPSADEVAQNGINLGEMNSKLLQKIEELTLYMIEFNKELQQLQEENKVLKQQVQLMKVGRN